MNRLHGFVLFLLCCTAAFAQPASWQPEQPRVGDVLTIYYNPRLGTISPGTSTLWLHWGLLNPDNGSWSTPPQSIWPAGSRLHTDNIAVQSPMSRGNDSIWSVTIDFDTTVHDIAFVFTDGNNNWDNNSGHNWTIHFITPGTVSWWTPANPLPGDTVIVFYDSRAGTLPDTVSHVTMHWGVNESGHGNWQLPPARIWPAGTVPTGQAAETPMISLGSSLFRLALPTDTTIHSLHFVFTDGTHWDNNNNQNWDIHLTPPVPPVVTHRIFRFDPRSAFASGGLGNINTVNLAGTFNGWSTSANPLSSVDQYGNHWMEVALPTGDTEYKFVLNGSNWQTDPDNPRIAPGGFNNSLITLQPNPLPQIYDIQPGENQVYAQGTSNVVVAVKVRPGDLGPGLQGTPIAYVNGAVWQANWNSATSQLTLNPLPSQQPYVDVEILATDSAGRTGSRHIGFGFKQTGYEFVDPLGDVAYADSEGMDPNLDLERINMSEWANGDSLAIEIHFNSLSTNYTMPVLTITGSIDGYGPVPGFQNEVNVPNLAAGGVSVLLLDPSSPFYQSSIHNCLHPFGDLSQAGPSVRLSTDHASGQFLAYVSKADLEAYLGSYQAAWYFTCTSYRASTAQNGYCNEVSSFIGGTDGVEDPDAYDALFMYAADVETKMFHNYGLNRRMTLDAPGRGVGAVMPSDIGPHMASPGPLCRIMTQGAPTIVPSQTIIGHITSSVSVTQAWLTQNNTRIPVTVAADSFVTAVTLTEGVNRFAAFAVDANGDTGRSPVTTFTLNVDHAPVLHLATHVQNGQCVLDASATTDPEQQSLNFVWTADSSNPAQVSLMNADSSVARFNTPTVQGEYYFNVRATDPDNNSRTGRTFFTVSSDSVHGFSNNECAYWVNNAIIYEIFVRSYSPSGHFSGVTADMQRIADLGVNCIWLMPIFEGPTDHGYEVTDYYHVEQDYGTEQDLRDLIAAAHAHGIKVILDMVLNHTSISHPFMQDAMRHGRYSHYWNWYDRDANGNYTYYYDWVSLPNLNLNNPETVQWAIDVSKYWIENFDIDGYRCDTAWGPQQRSPQFWVQWREELKKIKPECLLLAEADASQFTILNDRFDLAFDWNLHHQQASSFSNWFPNIPGFTNLTQLINNYTVWWPPYKNPLRFLENHDEVRFASANTAPQTKLAASFMMSIPGDVMLYYGQEIGTTSQRGLPSWGVDPNGFYPHYYRLTNARKLLPAMRTGAFQLLSNNQSGTCYSFARYGNGMYPVVWVGDFSPSSQVVSVSLDIAQLGLHPDSTYVVSDLIGATNFTATGSQLATITTSLNAYQSRLWVISDHAISVDTPPLRAPLPQSIRLGDAYPNPFNPSTVLPLELNTATHVTVKIYDVLGREVATLADEVMPAGTHRIIWDGTASGRSVGSGVYFAVMRAGSVHQVRKLLLVR